MSRFIEMFGGGNWPQKTLGEVGSFTRGGGFQKSVTMFAPSNAIGA